MGNRFGRNQRRKMRQALADAQTREDNLQRNNRLLRESSREARDGFAYVAEELRRINQDTTLLPPNSIYSANLDNMRRLQNRAPATFLDYGNDPAARYAPISEQVFEMVRIGRKIEFNKDIGVGVHGIHLFVDGPGIKGERDWRYMIDNEMFFRRGVHRGVLRDIAQRVAQDLVLHLEKSLNVREVAYGQP